VKDISPAVVSLRHAAAGLLEWDRQSASCRPDDVPGVSCGCEFDGKREAGYLFDAALPCGI
jgi:hypothetical protein